MSDLIDRSAAIDIERNATVDTNPSHFEAHQKFMQFMDDAEISSFGRWQWSNGFNTALTAVSIDLEKLPSAQPEPSQVARDIATIIENEKDMRVIAQPETHEKRTETHSCDCIERQSAIDATRNAKISFTMKSDIDFANYRKEIQEMFNNILDAQEKALKELPPAQPEIRTQMSSANLISRQAAIRKLKKMATQAYIDKLNGSAETVINCCIDVIERQIPSAQPERKTGRWIPQKGGGLCCSECGGYALDEPDGNFVHVAVPSKFCPHCGARMEGEG